MRDVLFTVVSVLAIFMPSITLANQTVLKEKVEGVSPHFQKIYVTPDQIVLTTESIFLLQTDGLLTPVRVVAVDAGGLYVIGSVCGYCGLPMRNNVCVNGMCPFYGQ